MTNVFCYLYLLVFISYVHVYFKRIPYILALTITLCLYWPENLIKKVII